MTKKKPLTKEQIEECKKLKAIYEEKKKELNLNQFTTSERMGISQSGVNHYFNGVNALNVSAASDFAKMLQVPVEEFSPRLAHEIASMYESITLEGLQRHTPQRQDVVTLEILDISASCGNGVFNPEYPQLIRSLEIPVSDVIELLGTADLNGVQLMPPRGKSMEPTIPEKSIALIKTNIDYFNGDGVYFFTFQGAEYMKRISLKRDGILRVTSDNEVFKESNFDIEPHEHDDLIIRGRLWKCLPLTFIDL